MKQISLSQGQVALVDDCDYEFLSKFKWYASRSYDHRKNRDAFYTFYAVTAVKRNGTWTRAYMHRLILKPKQGQEVDHIDHNGLNNTRANLRVVTHSENQKNRNRPNPNGFKWIARLGNKWMARAPIGQKRVYAGLYPTKEDAHKAALALIAQHKKAK